MTIRNFGVGPSALFPGLVEDITEIAQSGILEKSHRSLEFSAMSEKSMTALRKFLRVPTDYHCYYTASATEAMEMTIRNGIEKKSTHCTNGSFSKKWGKFSERLGMQTQIHETEMGSRSEIDDITVDDDSEALFITANETSTGAMFSPDEIAQINGKFPNKLLCVDGTSCAAGLNYDISKMDVFLYSVQKCMGMPAGLGIFICSPRFAAKAQQKLDNGGIIGVYNSIPDLQGRMDGKFQTPQTPCLMQIALLGKSVQRIEAQIGDIEACDNHTRSKAGAIYDFFSNHPKFDCFVEKEHHRSMTVAVIKGEEDMITAAKDKCVAIGINLQNGYGPAKNSSFRIANFLAHSAEDMQGIFDALKDL
jgi:phosphoserine aminotransferase